MVTLMSRQKTLKLIHLAGTIWFILCVGYVFVLALRQAGFRWWVIFSLSGHSALIIFLLVSIYLFAIFRGVGRNQAITIEHPLTSTGYYLMFYVATPLLAGLTSSLAMIGENRISLVASGVVLGTLGTTFVVWVVVDPAIALLELLVPQSRKSRAVRLARAKLEKERKQKDRQLLLERIMGREKEDIQRRQRALKPQAEKLAGLLTTNGTDFRKAECQAVDIGVSAWQSGGLSCMQQLRDMTMDLCRKKYKDLTVVDYVSSWWDGIGSWRSPSLG